MCGIAGLIGRFDEVEHRVAAMTNVLRHRGPDQSGLYSDLEHQVCLGHRRLSILDTTDAGRQPIERNNVVMVFNGEIYNYKVLRQELALGFVFSSDSDSEVLLAGYLAWGIEGVLSRIRGMFAFVIYDRNAGVVYLARDRMGEKPLLFYIEGQDKFAFASELKALMLIPGVGDIDPLSLDLYFTFGYVPAPRSIVSNVEKLRPGEYLSITLGENRLTLKRQRYWGLDPTSPKRSIPQGEALERLDHLVRQSVERSLFSDVPLGVFLSGGLDSSVVAAYAQASSGSDIETFSIGFDDTSFDESQYASRVAAHLGTKHHVLRVEKSDALDAVQGLGDLQDEPMSDMSLIPTYLLSRLARQRVTVALGGDGADELFIGYPTHLAHRLMQVYCAAPIFSRRVAESLIRRLPVSHSDFSLDFRLKRFVASAHLPTLQRHFSWQAHVPFEHRASLYFGDRPLDSLGAMSDFIGSELPTGVDDDFSLVEYLDLVLYLPNDIMAKVDIASMACSLEVRSPFLDSDLVEFVYSLPRSLKYRTGCQKFLLKLLAEKMLPKRDVYRKKHGFGIPLGSWLRSELRDYVASLLAPERMSCLPGIDPRFGSQLLDEHIKGRMDHRKPLWSLITLMSWMESRKK